jgi:hypothetical protein
MEHRSAACHIAWAYGVVAARTGLEVGSSSSRDSGSSSSEVIPKETMCEQRQIVG